MPILDKKTKNDSTPKNAKNNKLKNVLNIKMSTKVGPVFIFTLPGVQLAPLPSPAVTPLTTDALRQRGPTTFDLYGPFAKT